MSKRTLTVIKSAIASLFLAALIYWVHRNYGWSDTLQAWTSVAVTSIIFVAILVLLSHVLRVLRVYAAYTQTSTVNLKRIFGVSLTHNTLAFLLPMRLGEAALPALSRYQLDIDVKYSTAALVLIRLFDLHVLLMLLAFFTGHLWFEQYAVLIPVLLIAALPIGMKILVRLCTRVKKLEFAEPLIKSTRSWGVLYLYTIGIWCIKLYGLALLASALGNISIDHSWIATIIADASALSPVTGFANAGTYELAFSLPLLPLGYDSDTLVQTAVNLHIFIFVTNVFAGLIGFLLLDFKSNSAKDHLARETLTEE